jgi:hypothetical protein
MAETAPTPSETLEEFLADFRVLDNDQLTDILHDHTAAMRAMHAEHAALLATLKERVDSTSRVVSGADEIGIMLSISSRSADRLVDGAVDLCSRPLVWDAVHTGIIDAAKATKILNLLADVPDPERERLEAVAIAYAELHTAHQLHRKLIALTCDEDPDERQRKEALDRRHVDLIPAGHGMAWISIYTCADQAAVFMQTLDQMATAATCPDPYGQGDQRTLEQLRVDALTGFLNDHTIWDINVDVVIPADMLLGVETSGADLNGSPVTHDLAVELAWSPDARWTRLVTDPLTGTLLDAGKPKYEISKKLRTAIRRRDLTCRFPGCSRSAEFTDTDHVVPWPWGRTNPNQLICLCRHHHRLKTFEQWRISTRTDYAHETAWHGPLGTTTTTRPHNFHRRD